LSETQKVWIDVLLGAGIEVEVCKVMTHEDKNALDAKVAKAASAGGTKGGRQRRGKTSGGDSDEEE
jgi:Fanconi-associated nuclease 1